MFINKVKNAQNAGAIAVIVIDNGNGVAAMGGTDNMITIPAIMISATDGTAIKNALNSNTVVTATFNVPVEFDGGLDNGIIIHEYSHGISSRLTGGNAGSAGCLTNNEQGGEGWSDYMALMLTTDWTKAKLTDGALPRSIGTYAFGQAAESTTGIRTYPYSTNLSINPHTYRNVARNMENPVITDQGNTIPNATEVHYIGEVWCSAIWDVTWAIIQQEGVINPDIYDVAGGGGNVKALQLIMTAMKLQTCSPGFLDARNAILKADEILFDNAHKCAIWTAFARRGMGYSAVQGSSNSTTDQVEKFDVPGFVTTNVTISNAPLGGICAGTNFTFTATPVNGGVSPQYQWIRNGINEPGATSSTFTNKFNHNDVIRCVLTSNIACAANISSTSGAVIVPVNSIPVVSVTVSGALSFCSGDSVVLTSGSTSGNQWYHNGTSVNVPNNSVLVAKAGGVYTDTLTTSGGCKGGSSVVAVTTHALPVTPTINTATNITPMSVATPIAVHVLDTLISDAGNGNQWFLNNTAVTGATNQKHKTLNAGSYTVRTTNANGCRSDLSKPVAVVMAAIPAVPGVTINSGEWIVFPNPVTNGKLVIRKQGILTGIATAQVLSLDGRSLAEKKIGAHTEWNISNIATGVYYLRITEQKGVSVYTFIKQ
jgi:hypothetical protein